MSHTIRLFSSVKDAAGVAISGEASLTGGSRKSISESCGSSGTTTIALTIDVSALKLIFMVSDKDIDVEFLGPSLEVQLVAGIPFVWSSTGELANPFGSTDVTSVEVTNGVGSAANLSIEVLTDPTP